jgi:hypothetical protein
MYVYPRLPSMAYDCPSDVYHARSSQPIPSTPYSYRYAERPLRIVTEDDSGIFSFTVTNVSDDTASNIRFATTNIIASPGSTLFGNTNEIIGAPRALLYQGPAIVESYWSTDLRRVKERMIIWRRGTSHPKLSKKNIVCFNRWACQKIERDALFLASTDQTERDGVSRCNEFPTASRPRILCVTLERKHK